MRFLTVLMILSGLSIFGQTQKKKSVAVLEFRSSGMEQGEAMTLTDRFRGMLVETEAFNVVEQEKMTEVLKAQDFTLSDNCNSAECAVQVGQLLGVEEMIGGTIGKVGKTWTIDLRLVDVTTAKIVLSKSKNYRGEIDGLIDVMSDIAYSFAGKKNPNPSLNQSLTDYNTVPKSPGRIRVNLLFGRTLPISSTNKIVGPKFGFGIAAGFMVSRRSQVDLDAGLDVLSLKLKSAVILPDNSTFRDVGGYTAGHAGINWSYYIMNGGFQPFSTVGVGIQNFTDGFSSAVGPYKKFVLNQLHIKTGTYLYGSSALGADIEASSVITIRLLTRVTWAKAENIGFLGGGLTFKFGHGFDN